MKKFIYEANLLRIDGTVYGMEILTCDREADALAGASRCATRWAAPVRLYEVPHVNAENTPWREDEIRFVADIARGPTPFTATAQNRKKPLVPSRDLKPAASAFPVLAVRGVRPLAASAL